MWWTCGVGVRFQYTVVIVVGHRFGTAKQGKFNLSLMEKNERLQVTEILAELSDWCFPLCKTQKTNKKTKIAGWAFTLHRVGTTNKNIKQQKNSIKQNWVFFKSLSVNGFEPWVISSRKADQLFQTIIKFSKTALFYLTLSSAQFKNKGVQIFSFF